MPILVRRIVYLVLALGVIAGALVTYAYRDVTRGPLPQTSGALRLPGLDATVEVFRDAYGIPHIYAETVHDVVMAQGYVHAQDRWFQMDFYRRIAQGRLSEWAGANEEARSADALMQTLDLYAVAERDFASLESDYQRLYVAFAQGVNAYIESRRPSDLALEYGLLELQGTPISVEPWMPADSIAFGKLMGYTFSGRDLLQEPRIAALLETIGPEMLAAKQPPYPYDTMPTTIGAEDMPFPIGTGEARPEAEESTAAGTTQLSPSVRELLAANDWLAQWFPLDASNAWAVSGARTQTGAPLFASDPHQGIAIPNLWYEIGLHCKADLAGDPLDLYGYCAPPIFFVQAGHNARIAWGLTNVSGANALDLYRLAIDPNDSTRYAWNGDWAEFGFREGGTPGGGNLSSDAPLAATSHLGPLVPGSWPDDPIAIRWEGLERGSIQRAGIELAMAKSFDDFRAALEHWDYPAANIPYADVDGNIGFQMCGRFPIRPLGVDGLTPTPVQSDADIWVGFLPYDVLPYVQNPSSGMIVAANNPPMPEHYYAWLDNVLGPNHNYRIAPSLAVGHRAARITTLLEASSQHNVASFQRIQLDVAVPGFRKILDALGHVDFDSDALAETAAWLDTWDTAFDADAPHALLAAQFWQTLGEAMFLDELPEGSRETPNMLQLHAITRLLDEPNHTWWDDTRTADIETRDDILRDAFATALAQVEADYSTVRTDWKWGDAHRSDFVNPLLGNSGIGLVEGWVNRTGYPTSGGPATINIARWSGGSFTNRHIPAYRRIIDLGDMRNSVAINSTGQSGHPFSPHYDDQIEAWAQGAYRSILWVRADVEANAASKLVLRP